jgi:hypothetical protein
MRREVATAQIAVDSADTYQPMTHLTIPIHALTGEYASDSSEAWTIYQQIHPELLAGRAVSLDFSGVAVFSAVFFNVAIAQLLKDISPDNAQGLPQNRGVVRAWARVAEEVCGEC